MGRASRGRSCGLQMTGRYAKARFLIYDKGKRSLLDEGGMDAGSTADIIRGRRMPWPIAHDAALLQAQPAPELQ